MILNKKAVGGVPFAKKMAYDYEGKSYEADIKNGDKVTILDEGVVESGQFGDQHNFRISTRNGDKKISLNQSSINVLIDELGADTTKWVGKEVFVILKKDVIAGKKVEIAYLVVVGWGLDEYGDLVKSKVGEKPDYPINNEDIPY